MADDPGRRHPVHGVQVNLGRPTIIFLTVCTKGRQKWLANEDIHSVLVASWQEATAWNVGHYVLMPDHLHLFCAPVDLDVPLDSWVRYWKSRFRTRVPDSNCKWQVGHWDTRLRREENYAEKWRYVRNNPVRAGLVSNADDWPYQGELNVLRW